VDRTEKPTRYLDNDQRVAVQTLVSGGGTESDGRMFVFGNYIDEVLVMHDGAGDLYYAHDHLSSPVALLDDAGAVLERYERACPEHSRGNAYGTAMIIGIGPDGLWFTTDDVEHTASLYANPYTFTGRELDILDAGNCTLMYYRAHTYDPHTGRFMQRDPLGINPTGGSINPFSPTGQYMDGMNLYEYTKSKPFTNNDPYGLKTANDTNVCCKIKTTTTRYIPHGITTIVLPYQETSCTQMTISNPQGWSPGQACRCRYKNQKNVHVYNWHSGECCWCDVYIGWVTSPWPDGDADTDVRFHTKFYVKCDNNSSLDFTAETTPNDIEGLPSVGGLIIGGYPVLPQIDTGSSMHLKGYSWSYKGQISCANAEQAKMIASAETYWSVFHNCWHWAHQVANTVLDLCP